MKTVVIKEAQTGVINPGGILNVPAWLGTDEVISGEGEDGNLIVSRQFLEEVEVKEAKKAE